jgi:hypothetical protein
METSKKIYYFLEFCFLSALVPVIAHAQQAPGGLFDIAGILGRIVNILATAAGFIIIIVFILAGFKYLFARGDPGKISEANKALIWGLVGTAVIMLAWGAQNFVRFILGI